MKEVDVPIKKFWLYELSALPKIKRQFSERGESFEEFMLSLTAEDVGEHLGKWFQDNLISYNKIVKINDKVANHLLSIIDKKNLPECLIAFIDLLDNDNMKALHTALKESNENKQNFVYRYVKEGVDISERNIPLLLDSIRELGQSDILYRAVTYHSISRKFVEPIFNALSLDRSFDFLNHRYPRYQREKKNI